MGTLGIQEGCQALPVPQRIPGGQSAVGGIRGLRHIQAAQLEQPVVRNSVGGEYDKRQEPWPQPASWPSFPADLARPVTASHGFSLFRHVSLVGEKPLCANPVAFFHLLCYFHLSVKPWEK